MLACPCRSFDPESQVFSRVARRREQQGSKFRAVCSQELLDGFCAVCLKGIVANEFDFRDWRDCMDVVVLQSSRFRRAAPFGAFSVYEQALMTEVEIFRENVYLRMSFDTNEQVAA